MSWTDERVETLKRMWAEGQSASQIAKELGGVTRNAVIGKVHRLGLSNRGGPEGEDEGTAPAAAEPAPKPAPDSLLLASRLLGIAPQNCLYVGDDARDIEAAHAAGMKALAAAWGYLGEHPINPWGADAIIQTPAQILDFL